MRTLLTLLLLTGCATTPALAPVDRNQEWDATKVLATLHLYLPHEAMEVLCPNALDNLGCVQITPASVGIQFINKDAPEATQKVVRAHEDAHGTWGKCHIGECDE